MRRAWAISPSPFYVGTKGVSGCPNGLYLIFRYLWPKQDGSTPRYGRLPKMYCNAFRVTQKARLLHFDHAVIYRSIRCCRRSS